MEQKSKGLLLKEQMQKSQWQDKEQLIDGSNIML